MDKQFIKQITRMSSLGLNVIISSVIGFAIGYYLDKYTGYDYLFVIIFTLIGFIAGIYEIYKQIKKELNTKM